MKRKPHIRTKRTTTKSVLRIAHAIALLASVYFLDISRRCS